MASKEQIEAEHSDLRLALAIIKATRSADWELIDAMMDQFSTMHAGMLALAFVADFVLSKTDQGDEFVARKIERLASINPTERFSTDE